MDMNGAPDFCAIWAHIIGWEEGYEDTRRKKPLFIELPATIQGYI